MNFESTFYGRPNTIKTYLSLFNKHIYLPGFYDWAEWGDSHTAMMLDTWKSRNLSRSTKMTLMRILGRYVKFMGGPDLDTQKIIKSLERSEQQTEVTTLSDTEAKKLMETTKETDPKFYPVLLLALHAGLRRGEIFGLRCGDIDMLQGKIKISHSYNGPTKNGKSRTVPMSAELTKTLTAARNLMLRDPNTVIFERFDPNPTLRKVCSAAGVPRIRFHDLRHTFASLALVGGVNAKQVATWLGHSSVVTTLSIYWNLTNEEANLDFLP